MNSRKRLSVLASISLSLSLTSGTATALEDESGTWSDVSNITASKSTSSEKASAIRSLFGQKIEPKIADKAALSDDVLHDIYRAVETAYFYARTSDYASRLIYRNGMINVLDELHRRGRDEPEEVDAYHDGLVAARDFAAAEKLKKDFPGFSLRNYRRFESSVSIDHSRPSAFTADGEGRLVLSNVSLPDEGGYVVVVIGCHFAEDAAREIAKNKKLAAIMGSDRVLWVFSDLELNQRALNEWNRVFPRFKAMIAYDNALWVGVNFSAGPTFHFFRDRKLVGTQDGLEGTKGASGLAKMLEAIGLSG